MVDDRYSVPASYRFFVHMCTLLISIFSFLFLSCWRLVHKETTPFGPVLWLSVAVDQPPTPLPTVTPSQPPVKAPLTNDNLLRSIGFIPSGDCSVTSVTFGVPPPDVQDNTTTSFQSE